MLQEELNIKIMECKEDIMWFMNNINYNESLIEKSLLDLQKLGFKSNTLEDFVDEYNANKYSHKIDTSKCYTIVEDLIQYEKCITNDLKELKMLKLKLARYEKITPKEDYKLC